MKHYDYVKDDNMYLIFHDNSYVRAFMKAHGIEKIIGKRHGYRISSLTKRLLDEYCNERLNTPTKLTELIF